MALADSYEYVYAALLMLVLLNVCQSCHFVQKTGKMADSEVEPPPLFENINIKNDPEDDKDDDLFTSAVQVSQ